MHMKKRREQQGEVASSHGEAKLMDAIIALFFLETTYSF